MGSGKSLTAEEKGGIDKLYEEKLSISEIARKMKRSRCVIRNYINNTTGYGKTPRSGRPKKIKERTIKRMYKLASNKVTTANEIKNRLGIRATKRTIRNYLKKECNLKYMKMKGKPPLTEEHKRERLNFAVNHVTWELEWRCVFFSDEKKFNLDGPDGAHCYWRDLSKSEVTFSKRVQGGGSAMVWVGFCYYGKSALRFVNVKLNSKKYTDMLSETILPYFSQFSDKNFIFQQDNASCHRAKTTMKWFENTGISVLKWPSRSPDLNPVENLWAEIVKIVYSNGRQYNNVSDLKTAILFAWEEIGTDILQNLVRSMHKRMMDVILNQGGSINY